MGSKKPKATVRKTHAATRKPAKKPFGLSAMLLFVATFLFVFFVIWNILPRGETGDRPKESLSELKNRLDSERSHRREELEEELSEWQMKNEKLRREVERLKGE